ncbi:MAG: ATP synthase subunit I [Verrucomicrobiota bacterium]
MNEMLGLTAAGAAGFVAGMLFFFGLWLTVSHFQSARYSLLLIAFSFLGRTALALALFWWAAQGVASRLIAVLIGFLAARTLVLWLARNLDRQVTVSSQ